MFISITEFLEIVIRSEEDEGDQYIEGKQTIFAYLSLRLQCTTRSIETTRLTTVIIVGNRWHKDRITKRIVCYLEDRW